MREEKQLLQVKRRSKEFVEVIKCNDEVFHKKSLQELKIIQILKKIMDYYF